MGNSQNKHHVRQNLVNDGIREAANQQPPESALARGARLRRIADAIKAPAYLNEECLPEISQS
jgi:hypothetical protein